MGGALLVSSKWNNVLCSRQAGQRVSSHLDTIIPLIMYYAQSQVDDELRESCQQVGINCASILSKYHNKEFVYG